MKRGLSTLTIQRLDVTVDGVSESRLVALDAGKFVGTVALQHAGLLSAGIRQLFVEPRERRRGIARLLLDACCQLAQASACKTIGLSLAPANIGLLEDFYEPLGFIFAYGYEDGSCIVVKLLS